MLLLLTIFSTPHPLLALHHAKESDSSNSFELEAEEEIELERLGLGLSQAHARLWRKQFGRKGKGRRARRGVKGGEGSKDLKKEDRRSREDEEDVKKDKDWRKGRAYWGLDRIFSQATRTKDHFSKELAGLPGLVNRVGDLFGAGDDYDDDYDDEVCFYWTNKPIYLSIFDAGCRLLPIQIVEVFPRLQKRRQKIHLF